MRVLFVSSTTTGGSGRSQRALARRLIGRGHEVALLVDDKRPHRVRRWTYEQLSDLSVKLGDGPLAGPVGALTSIPGRRCRPEVIEDLAHLTTPVPQNALDRVLGSYLPEVVVGNSLVRHSWRRIRAICAARNVPTVLYVREVASFDHLLPEELPDAVVANAHSLTAEVERRGMTCTFVPSIIEFDEIRSNSSRTMAVSINPIPSHGVDVVLSLAERLPSIPFVLQESWELESGQLAALLTRIDALPNVELRRRLPPGPALYEDARVLLVPHRIDNRPRVIAEAQANAIPVIAADTPGLREAVGDGGIIRDVDDVAAWAEALTSMWEDEPRYRALMQRAAVHSARAELDPDAITAVFEAVLNDVLAR